MFNLIREHEISDEYTFLRLKAGMTKLLAFILLEAYGSNQNKGLNDSYIHEKMNVVGEYIRVNYRSKIALDHLAKYASLSKSHLLRLFRNVYDVSPIHFQLEYKISKAKLMLSSPPNTISEVSKYLCFTDLQHFSKVFKKFTGISPSSYRTQIRNKQDITTD
jgi:AraC-like DNA-binding protein